MNFICTRAFRSAIVLLAVLAFLPLSVSAKDEWLQVRSKNFFLVGNASEKEIRKVATKLEQFRETFRLVFKSMNLNSPIQTNVVVFKSDSSFKPYKPKRADGKIDNFVAGFFQPGEDVNYISLSTGAADEADTFGLIFHEYVHFIINMNFGKSDVPPWFNEGLAEYYQTFSIEEDQKVRLGFPQSGHLQLLSQTKLLPLEQLFKVTGYGLLQQGGHSRSVFYAQSWALIHYLIQSGKTEGLGKFLSAVLQNVAPEKAFQDSFQIGYPEMEKELRKYIGANSYRYNELKFANKLVFDTEMQVSPLTDAQSNAYLGDLLYHNNRADDAEPLLSAALALDPGLSMANTSMGMVKLRQLKFDEAKAYLEKAIAQDQKNHLALYQYAYLLSREGRDEFGYVREFSTEAANKMRELLKKAIAVNPQFTDSYELLAFVSLVKMDQLDEAVAYLQKALQYQPGNQRYLIRIAELYGRLNKYAEALEIAGKIAKSTDEPAVKSQANNLIREIEQRQAIEKSNAESKKHYDEAISSGAKGGTRPVLIRREGGRQGLSPDEVAKLNAHAEMVSINASLRKPKPDETRAIVNIQKIECKGRAILFHVKDDSGAFILSSKDFQSLELMAYVPAEQVKEVGCDAKVSGSRTIVTFKAGPSSAQGVRGELVAMDMVPNDFRFIDTTDEGLETTEDGVIVINAGGSGLGDEAKDMEQMRRESMMASIKEAMRKPEPGEMRAIGTIEKTECTSKGMFFYFASGGQSVKLSNIAQSSLMIRGFTPDIGGLQFGCGMKQIDIPVVFTYKPNTDKKPKTVGDLVSLEFVPKSFVLD